jgi:hypothetical protein
LAYSPGGLKGKIHPLTSNENISNTCHIFNRVRFYGNLENSTTILRNNRADCQRAEYQRDITFVKKAREGAQLSDRSSYVILTEVQSTISMTAE